MAQLLLITERTMGGTGNQQPGDIVAVFPDSHVFSDRERQLFDVVTVAESKASIEALRPAIKTMVRAPSVDWVEEHSLERKEAWVDKDGTVLEIKEQPRYPLAYKDGKVVETYSRLAANKAEILKAAEVTVRA